MPQPSKARVVGAALSLLVLLVCMWVVGRAGLSRYLISDKKDEKLLPAINGALWLTPSDPEVSYARAMVRWRSGDFLAAAKDYEQVSALRPHDYVAWLDLGSARDELGDSAGAIEAYQKATRLAPFYAEPYWELGYAQLQIGHEDEAFAHLRRAVASEPAWSDDLSDLAIEHYGDDPAMILRAVRPESAEHQLKLAQIFIEQGYASEALDLFKAANQPSVEARQNFLSSLLDAELFREAYDVWSQARRADSRSINDYAGANITDDSFEGQIDLSEVGFGWQAPGKLVDVDISQERNGSHSGAKCLHLNFHGKSQTIKPLISQLVLLEPERKYRLSFAARTQELIAGALPEVVVLSESDADVLNQTITLPPGTSAWNTFHLEFSAPKGTSAAYIILRRRSCGAASCPIFGHLWLDSFTLQRL